MFILSPSLKQGLTKVSLSSRFDLLIVSRRKFCLNGSHNCLTVVSSGGVVSSSCLSSNKLIQLKAVNCLGIKWYSSRFRAQKEAGRNAARYGTALALGFLGLTFASVPLYRVYCQSSGQSGQRGFLGKTVDKVEKMVIEKGRRLRVKFVADSSTDLQWDFKPIQHSIEISPGETTLAFFTAKNPLKEPVTGVATYTVLPFEAAKYLNKIQCFCFEEQRLNPGEEVDLPVFFYIDPAYNDDARLDVVDDIVLSYQFFAAREGMKLPVIGELSPLPT